MLWQTTAPFSCKGRQAAAFFYISVLFACSGILQLGAQEPASPAVTPTPAKAFLLAPAPDWISKPEFSYVPDDANKQSDAYGVYYMVIEEQDSPNQQENYHHFARVIASTAGIQSGSRISVVFDPAYETLIFHEIRILRNGTWESRLKEDQIKVIQRETEMESHVLNGSLTAFCNLEDVQVGDVIDYSYTIRGGNPLFAGHFLRSVVLQWPVPVSHIYYRVTMPGAPALQHKIYPATADQNYLTYPTPGECIWEQKNIAPSPPLEPLTPPWCDSYSWMQWSDFSDWKAVVDWILPYYSPADSLPPELDSIIAHIRESNTDSEGEVLAALKFVQEKVRYLGMEMGAGSFKPTDPATVYQRRFGDCKDKALLLAAILRKLKVEAYPAMVSTQDGAALKNRLPSPLCFNHVIVKVVLSGDRVYWLDATRTGQRGTLNDVYPGNYKTALVIQSGNEDLETMQLQEQSLPQIHVSESFDITDTSKPATLKIHTTYQGQAAEAARLLFQNTPATTIQQEYQEYLRRTLPGVRPASDIKHNDSEDKNIFEVWEEYEVADLWKSGIVPGLKQADFYPLSIKNEIVSATKSDRRQPLLINYPCHTTVETELKLFKEWILEKPDQKIENPFFRYASKSTVSGKIVKFTYDYQTLADSVPVESLAEYNRDTQKMLDELGHGLSYNPLAYNGKGADPGGLHNTRPNWPVVRPLLLYGVLLAGLAIYLDFATKLKFRLRPPYEGLYREGLGGWLILLFIGLVARCFGYVNAFFLVFGSIYDLDIWTRLNSPSNPAYSKLYGPLLIFEAGANLTFLIFGILTMVLFFQKRAFFRKAAITFLVLAALCSIVDQVLCGQIPFLAQEAYFSARSYQISTTCTATLVWVAYLVRSVRVRTTFRR